LARADVANYAQRVSGSTSVDDFCAALQVGLEHLGLEVAIVSRVHGDRYQIDHVVAPSELELAPGAAFALGDTPCSITLEEEAIVSIEDMGRSVHRTHPCYAAFGLESYIGTPLRIDGTTYGTLNFSSRERRTSPYSEADRGLVRIIASWVERAYERRTLVEEAEASAARFRGIFEESPDAIWLHRGGVVFEANAAAAELVGAPSGASLAGRSLLEFVVDESQRAIAIARIERVLAGERPAPLEFRIVGDDGVGHAVEVRGAALDLPGGRAGLTIARDVSERASARAKLMQADRLSSIGLLAAGVAHELNNPLSYVMANLDVAVEEIREITGAEPSHPLADLCDAIVEARDGADRARGIVRDLRMFSRIGEQMRAPVSVTRLIEVAVNMTRREVAGRARLTLDIAPTPLVNADQARLTQVFVNLLINATQALPEEASAKDHEITISTRVAEDGRVANAISDTGSGIDPELMSVIFDVFYTTKPAGEGTGLGLALSQTIVGDLGGEIRVANREPSGAVFTVLLPPSTADQERSSVPPGLGPAVAKRAARVLVIDDDRMVARAIDRVLRRDHEVVIVNSGTAALEHLLDPEPAFDVVLCDLMMPDMSGWDVHRAVLAEAPHMAERMVFITGGTLHQDGRQFLASVPNPHLDKPFEIDVLRGAVSAMAERSADSQ